MNALNNATADWMIERRDDPKYGLRALKKPILALHIRHGKAAEEGEHVPLARYLETVDDMVLKHGYKSVYLLTDDSHVLHTIRTSWEDPSEFGALRRGVRWAWTDSPPHNRDDGRV